MIKPQHNLEPGHYVSTLTLALTLDIVPATTATLTLTLTLASPSHPSGHHPHYIRRRGDWEVHRFRVHELPSAPFAPALITSSIGICACAVEGGGIRGQPQAAPAHPLPMVARRWPKEP